MKGIQLTLSMVIVIIVLLVTLVAITILFREQLGMGDVLTGGLIRDVNKSSGEVDLDPEKIFCPQNQYMCVDSEGNRLTGDFPTGKKIKDPFIECLGTCPDFGGTCKCVR